MVNNRNVYDVHHYDVDLKTSDSSSGFRRNQSEMLSFGSSSSIIGKDRSQSWSRSKSLKQSSGKSNSFNSNERLLYHRAIDQADDRLQRELKASKKKGRIGEGYSESLGG